MKGTNYRVLVTSAHTNAALAVTRSLGKRGIAVTCADYKKHAKSFYSKYCQERFLYPSPERYPQEFVKWVLSEVKRNRYDALFLTTDTDHLLILRNVAKFLPHVKLPMSNYSTFIKVLDKSETINVALATGVPTPKTIFVNNLSQLSEISTSLEYPLVIKSRQSSSLTSSGKIQKGHITYISSPSEFISKYEELHQKIPYPLIQEFIRGEQRGIFVLLAKGEVRALFAHKRIRSAHPLGGASALCESCELDPTMRDYALKILKEIGWNGVAMVEFRLDPRDNAPKLIEINGRFWGSLQLAISCGVDFPYLLFQTMVGGRVEPVLEYKVGVKFRDLFQDAQHLLSVLRGNPNHVLMYPKRLATLLNFAKFFQRDMVYSDISADDPMVAMKSYMYLFWELSRRLCRARSG